MAGGKPSARSDAGINASFMFMCVGGTSVCLCASNESSFNVDEWLRGHPNNAGPQSVRIKRGRGAQEAVNDFLLMRKYVMLCKGCSIYV